MSHRSFHLSTILFRASFFCCSQFSVWLFPLEDSFPFPHMFSELSVICAYRLFVFFYCNKRHNKLNHAGRKQRGFVNCSTKGPDFYGWTHITIVNIFKTYIWKNTVYKVNHRSELCKILMYELVKQQHVSYNHCDHRNIKSYFYWATMPSFWQGVVSDYKTWWTARSGCPYLTSLPFYNKLCLSLRNMYADHLPGRFVCCLFILA